MNSIFKIFQELKKHSTDNVDSFNVGSLPLIKNHKIGISQNEHPMFFIKCSEMTLPILPPAPITTMFFLFIF